MTAASLDEIRILLDGLNATVEREHERAAHRERIIDRLHEENQRLRRGELHAALEPVRTKLYHLHDLLRRESERTVIEAEHVPALLTAIADELAEALARTGVEPLPVAEGDAYDAARHRPVGLRPIDDEELDGTVASVQRSGFIRGETVVRRAEVIVARREPATEPNSQDPDGQDPDPPGGEPG